MAASVEYFTQVVFRDIQETYSSLTDLSCQFTVSAAVPRDAADSVAIFPVGWKSVKDHVCSVPVVAPDESTSVSDGTTSSDVTTSVIFPAASLPHNDNEFYQLCYVSGVDQRVRGASSPFQFTNDRIVEWEIVDGKDALFETVEEGGVTGGTGITGATGTTGAAGAAGAAASCEMEVVSMTEAPPLETCCQHAETVERLKNELQTVKQELTLKNDEVVKREAEFNCSLAALQVALDDSKQQNIEKTAQLEQLQTNVNELTNKLAGMSSSSSSNSGAGGGGSDAGCDAVPDAVQETINKLNEQMNAERNAKQQEIEEYKQEQDALRAELEKQQLEFSGKMEGLKSELETTRQQLKTSTLEVEQLKLALNKYKQSEADWKQRSQNRMSSDVTAGSSLSQEVDVNVDGDQGQSSSTDNTGAVVDAVVVDGSGAAAAAGNTSLPDLTATQQFERGKPVDKCPICNEDFGPNMCEELIASHIEDHVVRICPFCTVEFEPEKEHEFNMHRNACQSMSLMYDRNVELDNRQP